MDRGTVQKSRQWAPHKEIQLCLRCYSSFSKPSLAKEPAVTPAGSMSSSSSLSSSSSFLRTGLFAFEQLSANFSSEVSASHGEI